MQINTGECAWGRSIADDDGPVPEPCPNIAVHTVGTGDLQLVRFFCPEHVQLLLDRGMDPRGVLTPVCAAGRFLRGTTEDWQTPCPAEVTEATLMQDEPGNVVLWFCAGHFTELQTKAANLKPSGQSWW